MNTFNDPKTMKILIPVIFWSLLLYSCKEVSFREPQPAGIPVLKEVPAPLQGQYYSYDQATGEKADTLIVESWGYHFKDKDDKDWLGRGVLSDSLVVKFRMKIITSSILSRGISGYCAWSSKSLPEHLNFSPSTSRMTPSGRKW